MPRVLFDKDSIRMFSKEMSLARARNLSRAGINAAAPMTAPRNIDGIDE